MKLWLLIRHDDSFWNGAATAIIIRSESEKGAREIAHLNFNEKAWENEEAVSCEELSTVGQPEVVAQSLQVVY